MSAEGSCSMDYLSTMIANIEGVLKTIRVNDIADILLVTFVVYSLFKLIRETRAAQLVKGIFVLVVIYAAADAFRLNIITFLMKNLFTYGAFALLVMFQPELRRILEQMGRTKISGKSLLSMITSSPTGDSETRMRTIDTVVDASLRLSETRTGALVVLQRNTNLGEIAHTGTRVDATLSAELLCNVFYPKSPLHDGAMIIKNDRIDSAGCFLPLSENRTIHKSLGTRHRAALGMSENSDAVIVVVSEETGAITVAMGGVLRRGLGRSELKNLLLTQMMFDIRQEKDETKKTIWRKGKKR